MSPQFTPFPAPRLWSEKISPNFTVSEFSVSGSHPRLASSLPRPLLPNALALAMWVLEPIRTAHGGFPISITSSFRNAALNKAVGGSSTSQHLTATAADITCADIEGLCQAMLSLVENDQLPGAGQLIYYPEQRFIHVALRSNKYPFPQVHVHAPRLGLTYARVKPTWEHITALTSGVTLA